MKLLNRKKVVFAIGIICITIPILFALYFSAIESLKATQNTLLIHAQDVLFRADKTAEQIQQGINRLIDSGGDNPCSAKNLHVMREIDLVSSNIQAIGYLSNSTLL